MTRMTRSPVVFLLEMVKGPPVMGEVNDDAQDHLLRAACSKLDGLEDLC